ncbi:hypothetical protein [Endozoicomonas atrinae]|uniref:hypothetical protein n=1 Tax=Endozoicomonas atrinae TaxID=1333660 RepID=UPI0008268ADF|nr:hypothetical protein [Endozoicomonas atrinae]
MNIEKYIKLKEILASIGQCAIAVSGGVDSITLAIVAHQVLGDNATIVHAVSSAVPSEATKRVRDFTEQQGWKLVEINAGEMSNSDYQKNPANRCYHCKTCLYSSIARLNLGTTLSGTNLDDLDDYRPGLIAAREQQVRHPYVEAGISKEGLRAIAKELGHDHLSELPASPCLSSRVETGIPIAMVDLDLVDAIEIKVRSETLSDNVRCRVRQEGFVIEVGRQELSSMSREKQNSLINIITDMLPTKSQSVSLSPYNRGSAFLV